MSSKPSRRSPSPQPIGTDNHLDFDDVDLLVTGSEGDSTSDSDGGLRGEGEPQGRSSTDGATPPATNPSENVFLWSDGQDFVPDIHDFDASSSGITPAFPVRPDGAELEYFEAFFDDEVMTKIVDETNIQHDYLVGQSSDESESGREDIAHHSRLRTWMNTTVRELFVFFALIILMPHSKKHVISDYWKKNPLIGTPTFGKYMSRNRFQALLSTLHFANNAHPRSYLEDKGYIHDAKGTVHSFFQTIL